MKNLYTTLFAIFLFFGINAQNIPIQRISVLEQFTTENCGSCPSTLTAIEEHLEVNPNFIIISHHAGYYLDWLTIPVSTEHLEFYNNGGATYAPAGMVDRHYNGLDNDNYQGTDPGPVFWDASPQGANRIDERTLVPALATINIYGTNNEGVLNLTVSGEFLEDYTHTIGVSLWITEDSISTTGQSGASGTWMHRYTVRGAISDRLGDELTASTNSGENFNAEYSFTIDPLWNTDQLYLVAILGNINDGDVNDREIHNAKQVKLSDLQPIPSSISNINNDIKIYPNPAKNILNIYNAENANVQIIDIVGKLVISKNNITATQSINISKLTEGTYFVKINKNNIVETKKIVITK